MAQDRWRIARHIAGTTALVALVYAQAATAKDPPAPAPAPANQDEAAKARAADTESKMQPDERTILTHGVMAIPFGKIDAKVKPISIGYVYGIPRLGVPPLAETDAGQGVSWILGKRGDEGATALPAALATASSWDPDLARAAGQVIGNEARGKGYNFMLAGGVNIMRDPRNGRTFEYYSEDPLLSGTLAGAAIAGIQSNHIISTVKHYALNSQETARPFIDSRIGEAAARESDLLAFKIAIEGGRPGAVMCSYNRVNGAYACDNDWLLNKVLKTDWRYPGFVISDWGAVPGASAAMHGLDQESGVLPTETAALDKQLADLAAKDPAVEARLRDMNRRILYAIYANGLDRYPPVIAPVDWPRGLAMAERVEREGIVLLRNQGDILPLAKTAKRIALIGGYADTGVLSGGGSTQVQMQGGPAASIPVGGTSFYEVMAQQQYHRSVPLAAIRALAPKADVTFTRSDYISDVVAAAKDADVAIVFANEWRSEGKDSPDLSLPNAQDALIEAVTAANPRTIVVLQTGGPVLMPWLDRTAAVIEAWYPGGRGAEALAAILFGDANPGGRLPVSFPRSTADLPRPVLDGVGAKLPSKPFEPPAVPLSVNYDIEGSDVGYRWFARTQKPTLFPFGFGLSYTSFARGSLRTDGKTATLTVTNTGKRDGADVAQLYLVSAAGKPTLRLVGFRRVALRAGEQAAVKLDIDQRLLADWVGAQWSIKGGIYKFALGADAEHLQAPVSVNVRGRRWKD